ncbi:hypothetical protein VNO78_11961 [Psophocarpus tetragonolobus]|uniref:Band 7 domain-containing protein n=1 Tax=Psophocarpus tetragonolobus TaxID=3891 RepID=A0AAN9SPY7_PSOTE
MCEASQQVSSQFHLKMTIITQYESVQVTLQTDQVFEVWMVTDIPCGTKGDVMISFGKIEVVNRLRKEFVFETLLNYGVQYDKTYDNIHHEINQFCSSHSLQQVYIDVFDQVDCTCYAPGIEIISVHVTKPTIPKSIRPNFEQMEEARTKKVAEKEAETMKKMAISEVEKNANVSKMLTEQKLLEEDSARRQEELEDAAHEKSKAVADFYSYVNICLSLYTNLTFQFAVPGSRYDIGLEAAWKLPSLSLSKDNDQSKYLKSYLSKVWLSFQRLHEGSFQAASNPRSYLKPGSKLKAQVCVKERQILTAVRGKKIIILFGLTEFKLQPVCFSLLSYT